MICRKSYDASQVNTKFREIGPNTTPKIKSLLHDLWCTVQAKLGMLRRVKQSNPFNPIVPNWLKVAFQLDTMEYLCHTKVQVPLFPQCRMALCPSWW